MSRWKRVARSTLRRLGYDVRPVPRKPLPVPSYSIYHSTLLALLGTVEHLHIVQVGANDGAINDPLYEFVRQHADRTQIVLVEPQPLLRPYLSENYSFHPNATIVSCAVGPEGSLHLYAVAPHVWPLLKVPYARGWPPYRAPSGVTSPSRDHVARWLSRHLKNYDVDAAIEEHVVRCLPLTALLRESAMRRVDVLQVDAEGFDDEVIYHSMTPELRPTIVHFEASALSRDRFDRLARFLADQHYVLHASGRDCLAVRISPERGQCAS